MNTLTDLDPQEIDPDGARYFDGYGSMPDPENIDRQLLREYRKNSHIKPKGTSFTDTIIALVLVLLSAPLVYASVLAVIHFGLIGLVVGLVLSLLFISALVYVAGLFRK